MLSVRRAGEIRNATAVKHIVTVSDNGWLPGWMDPRSICPIGWMDPLGPFVLGRMVSPLEEWTSWCLQREDCQ